VKYTATRLDIDLGF